MRPWPERSPEERTLLNPALIAAILREAAQGHAEQIKRPMPFVLGFLVVPVVLHPESRSGLPNTLRTAMPAWLGANPRLRATVQERVPAVASLVREGALLGLSAGVLQLDRGGLTAGPFRRSEPARRAAELQALLQAARFVGRWVARVDSPATVYALWGVQP